MLLYLLLLSSFYTQECGAAKLGQSSLRASREKKIDSKNFLVAQRAFVSNRRTASRTALYYVIYMEDGSYFPLLLDHEIRCFFFFLFVVVVVVVAALIVFQPDS